MVGNGLQMDAILGTGADLIESEDKSSSPRGSFHAIAWARKMQPLCNASRKNKKGESLLSVKWCDA